MYKHPLDNNTFYYSLTETCIHNKNEFKEELFYSTLRTSNNSELFIASSIKGICFLSPTSLEIGLEELKKQFPKAKTHYSTIHSQASSLNLASNTEALQLTSISESKKLELKGKEDHIIQLHLIGTAFQLKVWKALLKIPVGDLVTYRFITELIQYKKAYQAVGSAIARNPIYLLIPCHRVIRMDGGIGGYRWGNKIKTKIITAEKKLKEHFNK